MTDSTREDFRQLVQELGKVKEWADDAFAKAKKQDQSPASLEQLHRHTQAFHVLYELTNCVLSCITDNPTTITPAYTAAYLENAITKARQEIATIEAWTPFPRETPWKDCQISRSDVQYYSYFHKGTGNRQSRGSSSSSDYCGGPLRTPQEIALGMCGSCLKKLGPKIGVDQDTPAEYVPEEWKIKP